ncbi:toll/interleukin-1 receptor domain-containing protein [Aequorivita sp. H23M31]|uniref:Toll/interleukin-1 receptor domain-containing protein n=1 Tax=Aequorivita ciconiae TaxID=2494375 RepID=A0A410G5K0_9FLAO|nr:toll/interleukin-1 receptor domain-containing protein [Aequorivita sp. H23M31]QAA82539.1 toll/interleukin-1 receptor domain-containing protein [Aequorivita sp. H23M31]
MNLLTLKRLAVYLLTFFVILGLSFAFAGIWKQWDRGIYRSLYMDNDSATEKLSGKIMVVDLEKPEMDSKDASLGVFRKRIISFLNTVAHRVEDKKEYPRAVILDISFSKDSIELKELKKALVSLKDQGVKIYAVYSLKSYFENEMLGFQANDVQQATVLYDSVFDGGRLHAGFRIDDDLITYPSDIFINGAFDTVKIESVIKRVVLDDRDADYIPEFRQFVAPLGPIEPMYAHTYNFEEATGEDLIGKFVPDSPESSSLDLRDKFIIVGDLKHDYQQDLGMARTYIMAWALNERIIDSKIAKQPLDSVAIIIGQTIFFSLFTVLIFAFLFKYWKGLQTKPKIIAVLAFVVGLVFFILYGILIYNFDRIIPIGLTLIGMVIATLLAWRFAYKFLVTGIAEGSQKYDVFISYSHGNSDWVKKNVLEPLRGYRKPNGDKLNIFFDEKSIGVGEAFTSKYMWAIVDSKYFLPVISEEYYKKNHCRNEMDLAYKRYVEKLLLLLPIAFSYQAVPEIYNQINFADITATPNFMDKIKEELEK